MENGNQSKTVYISLKLTDIVTRTDYRALVPRPTEDEYRLLKEDVQAHGVHTPVVVNPAYELLDGYTRAEVAGELRIAELLVKVDPPRDPLSEREYVIRANLNRRHLTGAQKDKLGLALLGIERERAAERQRKSGETYGRGKVRPNLAEPIPDTAKAVEKAGKAVGRSPESIRKAERIEKRSPSTRKWTDLKTQWEQAQLGNDSTDATYRALQTLETEHVSASRFGDLEPRLVLKRPGPVVPAPRGA